MKKLLVVALALSFGLTACSTAWVTTLDSILAEAAPALINILQIVAIANGTPMNANLAAKINTDAAAIKTLAADFSKDGGSNVCTSLNAAIATYSADQALVLQVAQVSDSATAQKIALLSSLVASTVGAITAVIPSCQVTTSLARSIKVEPPLSLRTFIGQYNRILTTKTGNAAVDAVTPKLQVHQHSKVARVASFGYLK